MAEMSSNPAPRCNVEINGHLSLLRDRGHEGRTPTVRGPVGPSVTIKALVLRDYTDRGSSRDLHSDSFIVASGSKDGWIGGVPGDRVHSARGMCLECDNELSGVFPPDIDS
jgi:hypothetical protein